MTLDIFSDKKELEIKQKQLAKRIIQQDANYLNIAKLKTITGFDVAYSENYGIAGAVTLNIHTNKIEEMQTSITHVEFPYIPSLLSYRELPPLINIVRILKRQSDVFMIDGHGIAHPRGLGLASHFGLEVERPTIGIAKKRLIGEPEFWPDKPGECASLIYKKKIIGAVLRPKKTGNPIFISIGHLISLSTAIELVMLVLMPQHRIPEPIRLADQLARKMRKEFELKKEVKR